MKIRCYSDIHLEFDIEGDDDFVLPVIEGESDMVLVLAGDITAEMDGDNLADRLWSMHTTIVKDWAARHKAVVMVCGNHEFYRGSMDEVREWWSNVDANVDNFHFLDNTTAVIDGVRFIGGTLWTSLRNNDPLVALNAVGSMNDFNYIRVGDGMLTAAEWLNEYRTTLDYIQTRVAEDFDGPTVVVTHHAPSYRSIDSQYVESTRNDCYASDLDAFMWHSDIALWLHGHIHASSDYFVGDDETNTRVVCNPRGYNGDPPKFNPNFDPTLVITV